MRESGFYSRLGELNFFIPYPLPPANPPLEHTEEMVSLSSQASFALGRLNEIAVRVPSVARFIKAYVIKEALLSSAIEGIHTTLFDVFTSATDAGTKQTKDTQLVVNYTQALECALQMMRKDGLPLSLHVILRAHEVLMADGEGDKAMPGQFRRQSVRVGPLISPLAQEVPQLMSQLELYIHEPSPLLPLIRAGLVHVQFETIHPFSEGNGRIGRLLIVLMLIEHGLLTAPILYPSYYFKKHHLSYYHYLDRVRTHGDFEGWLCYYLVALRDSAQDAYTRVLELEALEQKLNQFVQHHPRFVRSRETALRLGALLFEQPVTTLSGLSEQLEVSYNTVLKIVQELVQHQFLHEGTTYKRNKRYYFTPYLSCLEKEY